MTLLRGAPILLAAVAAAACSHAGERLPSAIPPVPGAPRTAFALQAIEIATGAGVPAEPRKCIFAHYTGWLTDGTKFDSSRDPSADGSPRTPIAFPQGFRRVIAGWDLGFEGMRVGGRRRLIIPYQLAYGEAGRPPVIPPRATLVFDVELMAVSDTLPLPRIDPATGQPAPAPRCPAWSEVRP